MIPPLRLATPKDAAGILTIYGPIVREGYASFEGAPPSETEMAGRIQQTLDRYPWIVWDDHNRILGYAYAGAHRSREGYRWAVEVSVYVHPDVHRRGIGRALYIVLFNLLAAQGIVNAYAGIALPNEASVRLHETLGFRQVALYTQIGFKAGAWRDTGWWHLRLGVLNPNPSPPTPFAALDPAVVQNALMQGLPG